MPDFDSDNSRSFNIIMNIVSITTSFIFIIIVDDPRLFIIGLGIYIFFRYGISVLIQRITVHRGIAHSISALVVCSLSMTVILRYFDIVGKWFVSGSLGIGFFSHLLLDEINSLYDFKMKKFRIKKSFGSACKIGNKSWSGFTAYGIIIIEILIIILGE